MYRYFCDCVSWDRSDVFTPGGLSELIEQRHEITRATFLKHVDRDDLRELEESLCYAAHPSQGLTMAGDWHVEYFRSTHHGERVYGFRHSAIEYVFKLDKQHAATEAEIAEQSQLIQGYCPAYRDNRPGGLGRTVYSKSTGGETNEFLQAQCTTEEHAWKIARGFKPASLYCVPCVVPINGLCEPVL